MSNFAIMIHTSQCLHLSQGKKKISYISILCLIGIGHHCYAQSERHPQTKEASTN